MVFSFSAARLLFFVNFAPIVSIIILVAFIKTNVTFSDTINRVFFLVCAAAFLLVVADSTRFVTARMEHPGFLRYFSKSFGYILRVSIIYLTTLIAKRGKTKKIFLYSLPLLLCIILVSINLTSFGRGLLFSCDENNVFHRGPLGFSPHFICFVYSCFLLYYSFKNFSHNRYEPLVVIIIEVAAFTAMAVEILYDFDFILCHVLITSVIFYYFFLTTMTYKRDPLTKLLNRRCFYLEVNHLKKSKMIILSMDLNNLKVYNDTRGHAAGDRALVTVSQIMEDVFIPHARLYRTGGDEFMAIFTKGDKKFIEQLVEDFQTALKATEYMVACGIAEYLPGDDIEKVITLSDERMYSHKVKLKNSDSFKKI